MTATKFSNIATATILILEFWSLGMTATKILIGLIATKNPNSGYNDSDQIKDNITHYELQ